MYEIKKILLGEFTIRIFCNILRQFELQSNEMSSYITYNRYATDNIDLAYIYLYIMVSADKIELPLTKISIYTKYHVLLIMYFVSMFLAQFFFNCKIRLKLTNISSESIRCYLIISTMTYFTNMFLFRIIVYVGQITPRYPSTPYHFTSNSHAISFLYVIYMSIYMSSQQFITVSKFSPPLTNRLYFHIMDYFIHIVFYIFVNYLFISSNEFSKTVEYYSNFQQYP